MLVNTDTDIFYRFVNIDVQFLDHYGEVSMLDIKGADAAKAVLVVGIMTLHSFGEGAGVGVSFAGSKGLSQGVLVTLAIAVHNIPEGLAVSMVLASKGVSPHKAMLWSVITSLPQVIKRDLQLSIGWIYLYSRKLIAIYVSVYVNAKNYTFPPPKEACDSISNALSSSTCSSAYLQPGFVP